MYPAPCACPVRFSRTGHPRIFHAIGVVAPDLDALYAAVRRTDRHEQAAVCTHAPCGLRIEKAGDAVQVKPGGELRGDPVAQLLPVSQCAVAVLQYGRIGQAAGKQVNVWTPNREEEIRRCVAMGVDGIITNYPDRALDLVKEAEQ